MGTQNSCNHAPLQTIKGGKTMIPQKSITIRAQDRDGYWAAYVDPLGIVIYGKTEDDANSRANRAVHAAINSLNDHAGLDAVKAYLDGRGVRCNETNELELTPVPVTLADDVRQKLASRHVTEADVDDAIAWARSC